MKNIKTIKGSRRDVIVYKTSQSYCDSVEVEYCVIVYSLDGFRLMGEDYYTDDKQDALSTAATIASGG